MYVRAYVRTYVHVCSLFLVHSTHSITACMSDDTRAHMQCSSQNSIAWGRGGIA